MQTQIDERGEGGRERGESERERDQEKDWSLVSVSLQALLSTQNQCYST